MYRYLALIWNPADREAAVTARALALRAGGALSGWQRALDVDGATVLHSGAGEGASETLVFNGSCGVVLGTIFSSNIETVHTARSTPFDEAETARIVASGGRRLFTSYWGRYVALVRNPGSGELWVLRDPMGQMPCMLATHQGVSLVFSDLEDCLKLGVLKFSINWPYVAGVLANPTVMNSRTGLNEVSEVQLGERLHFNGARLQRSIEWNPFEIARTDPLLEVGDAVSQLRSTVRGCVHAWASRYRGLIHNLSGGLDSSIVLSCLKTAPTAPPVTCLNYYGTGPAEDERQYARLMASHAATELVEHLLDPAEVRLDQVTSVKRSARPWFYMYELEHGAAEARLAQERGADGLFSGAGGDGIFFQTRAELAVADYLFDRGFGSGLMHTAMDAAQMAGKSVWPLLFKAVKSRVFQKRWNPITESGRPERTLISADVMRAASREGGFQHPWFTREATRGVAPGVLWHVACVSAPPAFYNFLGPEIALERTLPLMSQPLVELCLRMPTYMLIKSGRDRAVARRAFAGDLPEQTIRRIGKGRVDHHIRNVLDANLQFVREFLLEGILVREGLLNKRNLDDYLTRDRSPADHQYSEILQEHVSVEAWLRRCVDLPAPLPEQAAAPPPLTSSCESAG